MIIALLYAYAVMACLTLLAVWVSHRRHQPPKPNARLLEWDDDEPPQ